MPFIVPHRVYIESCVVHLRVSVSVFLFAQNNIWNTNFPQFYPFAAADADARFRFELQITQP